MPLDIFWFILLEPKRFSYSWGNRTGVAPALTLGCKREFSFKFDNLKILGVLVAIGRFKKEKEKAKVSWCDTFRISWWECVKFLLNFTPGHRQYLYSPIVSLSGGLYHSCFQPVNRGQGRLRFCSIGRQNLNHFFFRLSEWFADKVGIFAYEGEEVQELSP